MIHIGVRAHDYGAQPFEELAAALSGVCAIQLALTKAITPPIVTPASLSAEERRSIRDALVARGVNVAILGCYINPVHPDRAEREAALLRFEEHIQGADDFSCPIVGTETGSIAPDCSFHPDTAQESTFQTLVASIRRLAKAAERTEHTVVGVEAVAEVHTVGSAALMARLLVEVDSPALGVIFDPTNLVPSTGLRSQEAFLDECFSAFGDRIVAIHAKDYRIQEGCCGPRKSPPLPAGTGELDWEAIFRRLKGVTLPPRLKDSLSHYGFQTPPILLEDAGPADAPEAIKRLQAAWARA